MAHNGATQWGTLQRTKLGFFEKRLVLKTRLRSWELRQAVKAGYQSVRGLPVLEQWLGEH